MNKEQSDLLSKELYEKAIKEFVKDTIHHPSFFELTPEQQKEKAMQVLRTHKK